MNTRTLVFCISCIVMVAWAILFSDYSIDDAFITFRYAENLADGHGLVFNPDDAPVEGYSNTLWLFILALLYKLGFTTYPTAKVIGLAASAVAGAVLFVYFKNDEHPLRWLAGPLFLASPPLAFWSLSGLELGLHSLILVLAFLTTLRQSRWAFALLALLVLSRPEGAPIGLVMVTGMALSDFLNKRLRPSFNLTATTVVIATLAALTLFRMEVFGYPFPNTYYAKTGHGFHGFGLLLEFLIHYTPLSLAAIWGFVLVARSRANDKLLTACLAVFVAQAVISASVDPVMNLLYRYLVPSLPLFLIAGLTVIGRIKFPVVRYILVGAILALTVSTTVEARELQNWNRKVVESQNKVIAWAGALPDPTTISMTDMGRVPYYSRKEYNDLWGLVDLEIAHDGYNAIREFLHLPAYFVLVGYIKEGEIQPKFWRERYLTGGQHFLECYQFERICLADGALATDSGYHYIIFRRSPDAGRIVLDYGKDYWQERATQGY